MAKWIVWNNSENRMENTSVYASQTLANDAITRMKRSRSDRSHPRDTLVSKQVD